MLISVESYLAGDISTESIMVDDVVLERDVDPLIVILESPVRIPGFGPDAFSVDQLLETSCTVIGSSHGGSSKAVAPQPNSSIS